MRTAIVGAAVTVGATLGLTACDESDKFERSAPSTTVDVSPKGDADSIEPGIRRLAAVTMSGTGVTPPTPTEFVALLCKQQKFGHTRKEVAHGIAMGVVVADAMAVQPEPSRAQQDKEIAHQEPNALAFVAKVSACQVLPES
ncbi:hypothetical protein FZI85_06405 [Mycobacterium sp. CBMA293]|uniref:hypothetical protein n=1 Tax=unclassified Mycolicibacterium TaxID=2636767 RepID=UPI0012DF7AF5|nr:MULTISPECIES: hypothetical protein [unclassified Mycolicibacterium]MUL45199.1 hypothetical protein [Mycolicibacterium sp. CBMA 360]MUL56718.1 hypothetical protein [Mycolicibacterium sp. CBMA 335]MUL69757.1 hypothetical protein [Mycolicibacterium sp. CBMA 311]MUL91805.1 hypothetical protein [Mycolicibacterium sp. CBMA 230]MUM10661.1 hypothetical protein [Mycolicibacterium sp. CBMA 293]